MSKLTRRLPLPLSSGVNILPEQTLTLTSRSQLEDFWPDRILIKNAESWRVERVEIDGRPQLSSDLPMRWFSPRGPTSPLKMSRVPQGGEFKIGVTYVGHRENGEPFECCAFGTTNGSRETPPARERARDALIVDATSTVEQADRGIDREIELALPARTEEFWPEHLTIKNPGDWVVGDIRVNDRSCLVQSGELPGLMFAEGKANSPLHIGPLSPRDKFTVVAFYVGDLKSGIRFEYSLSGPKHADDVSPKAMRLLPMSSGVNILPNTSAAITSRLSDYILPGHGFRPRRIVIEGAGAWVIDDIKIGVISQFAQNGDIPGVAFASDTVGNFVELSTIPVGIDFTIIVTYVGDCDSGAAFVCGVAGDVVDVIDQKS